MNILHIAAHLGGGVGKAISGIAIQGQEMYPDQHRILLLQQPEKCGYVQSCQTNSVQVHMWDGDAALFRWADIIVVSWWNHPVMAQFLHDFPSVPAPLLLWSHVNGCHYPMLPYSFVNAFDGILFTSPYSQENPTWTDAERRQVKARSELVWGMGCFSPEQITAKTDYQTYEHFTIGYVGTLNYGKLHPRFIDYCKAVRQRIPGARFVMAGDRDEALERDVRRSGLEDRFIFPGYVSNVPALMRSFDVFGYLLNPEHYGTTENVLLEAMACGVPVAALCQNVEQYIIPPEAGYLVQTPEQYAQGLTALWRSRELRERFGNGGRAHILKYYCAADNTAQFREACRRTAAAPGLRKDFAFLGASPWEWFLFFLDETNRQLMTQAQANLNCGKPAAWQLQNCSPILREERKSSLRHFAALYPEDENLVRLCNLLKG